VAYPRKKTSQNSSLSEGIDEQPLPPFSQPGPFAFTFSATPEPISEIKAKEDEKEGAPSKKVKECAFPSQGISVALFLEQGSHLIQRACSWVCVAEGAIRSGDSEGIILGGLSNCRSEKKQERQKEDGGE
jgi:hypothetical protein